MNICTFSERGSDSREGGSGGRDAGTLEEQQKQRDSKDKLTSGMSHVR